jgi:hypothetical protein
MRREKIVGCYGERIGSGQDEKTEGGGKGKKFIFSTVWLEWKPNLSEVLVTANGYTKIIVYFMFDAILKCFGCSNVCGTILRVYYNCKK